MPLQLFALERYESGHDGSLVRPQLPETVEAQLISLIRLPEDEVQLALVEGPDAGVVTAAMTAAGWRVDRITTATWVCAPIVMGTAPDRPDIDSEVR